MSLKLKVKGNTHWHTVSLMLRFWSLWTCHNEQVRSRKLHGNSVMTWAYHCRCALEYSCVSLTIVTDEHWSRICPPCEYWMFLTPFQTLEVCLICCSNVYVCLPVCLSVVQVYNCTIRTKKTSDILQSSTFRTFYYWILEVGGDLLPWEEIYYIEQRNKKREMLTYVVMMHDYVHYVPTLGCGEV